MKRIGIALALLAITAGSLYAAWQMWTWSWVAVAVTAILGLIGMFLCWRRARFAALWAAIDVILVASVGIGFERFQFHGNLPLMGAVDLTVSLDGPSAWPMIIGAMLLLLYQAILEIVERRMFAHILESCHFGWAKTGGSGSTAMVNSTAHSVISGHVGGHNDGQIAIGNDIQQVQFHRDVSSEIQAAADLLKSGRIHTAE